MSAAHAVAIADYRPRPELLQTRAYELPRYQEFRRRHHRAPFVPDFVARKQATILDIDAPDHDRVEAWVELMSYGNFNDLATDAADNPLGQADCARALGLSRQRVNIAIERLERSCRLRRDGRTLYPIDDPIAEANSRKRGNSDEFVKNSLDNRRMRGESWRRYQEYCNKENPLEAETLRAADEIKKRRFSKFKSWFELSNTPPTNDPDSQELPGQEVQNSPDKLSKTPPTNEESNLIDQEKQTSERPASSSISSLEPETTTTTPPPATSATHPAPAVPQPTPTKNPSVDENAVSEAIGTYAVPEPATVRELLRQCRAGTPDASGPEIAAAIHSKRNYVRKARAPIPYLLESIPKLFAGGAIRHQAPAAELDPAHVPSNIRRLREQLAELEHYQRKHPGDHLIDRDIAVVRDLLAVEESGAQ